MGCSLRWIQLEQFFCCCSVRTGSLIIGTLGWINTVIVLFALLVPSPENKKENELIPSSMLGIFDLYGMRIGYAIVDLLASLLLVFGVYKRDKRLMLPFLVSEFIGVSFLTIAVVIIFIGLFYSSLPGAEILLFLYFAPCTIISWYFWLCVWSHYMELTEVDQPPPVYCSTQESIPAKIQVV